MIDRFRTQQRPIALAVAVAVVVLTGAACGSSHSSSAGTAATSAPSTTAHASAAGDASILGAPNQATGTPVKVGLLNVEGGTAVSLPEIGDAAVAAAKYANAYLGGLDGHVIQVDRCADKDDGASATACGNRFVQDNDVAVVAAQPAQADLAVPTVVGAKIPYVGAAPAATSEITSAGTYFFSPGFVGTLGALADWGKLNNEPKEVMFGVDNPQLNAAVQILGKPLFTKAGDTLQLVSVPEGTADATAQVQSGLASNPDVVSVIADNTVCQAVLTALQTASNSKPLIVINTCTAASVVHAVGSALNNATVFGPGDATGDNHEAMLYREVMKTYAPNADPNGLAVNGYIAMLGFIRAVNAGGVTGDLTPATVTAAIKGATNVPLPLGENVTFSCDKSAINSPLIKATICNSKVFASPLKNGVPTTYQVIDPGPLFGP